MKHVKLRTLDVGRICLRAMGMSAACSGAGSGDAESIRTIHRAVDLGVTLMDAAEVYGRYADEELVGRALKGRRDLVVLATNFGFRSHTGRPQVDSSPAIIGRSGASGKEMAPKSTHTIAVPPALPNPMV